MRRCLTSQKVVLLKINRGAVAFNTYIHCTIRFVVWPTVGIHRGGRAVTFFLSLPNEGLVLRRMPPYCRIEYILSHTVRMTFVFTIRIPSLAPRTKPDPDRFVLDRRIFAYRAVVSDDGVASVVVICTFFASVSFIALFLGLESIHEGITAGQDVSAWVRGTHLFLQAYRDTEEHL